MSLPWNLTMQIGLQRLLRWQWELHFLRCGSGCYLPGWDLMLPQLARLDGDGLELCRLCWALRSPCDASGILGGRATGLQRHLFLLSDWLWWDFTDM